jgi:hypothetical protein
MVARPQGPRAPRRLSGPDFVAGVFGQWRAVVSRVLRAIASSPLWTGAGVWLADVSRFVVRPAEVMCSDDARPRLLVSRTGYACLAVGAVVTALLTLSGGTGPIAAATDAAWLVVWAAARFAVMHLASGEVLRARASSLRVAWAGGLIPLAVAVTPLLHAAALVASAALTWRALRASGAPQREATAVVGWGFGGQAAVEVLAWIVRGGVIYALLLGR